MIEVVGAVAFILALIEAYWDIRQLKAPLTLGLSAVFSLPLVTLKDFVGVLASAFFATFLVALADRITTVPITVSRAVGSLR